MLLLFYPAGVAHEKCCWVRTDLPNTISISSTPSVLASVFCVQDTGRIIKNSSGLIPNIDFLLVEDLKYIESVAIDMDRLLLHKTVLASKKSGTVAAKYFTEACASDELRLSIECTHPKGL